MPISKTLTKTVTLTGITPILFDRYAGDNKSKLSPDQRMYLIGNQMVLPNYNIMSFLTAQNTESAPKLLLDKREYRTICSALLASVTIEPFDIPFLRDGKPIEFGVFDENDFDAKSGVRIHRIVARLKDGIPNPKERPMLSPPWELRFKMEVLPHPNLSETTIENLFVEGGARLGLGTFRKMFGKFRFSWE